MSLCGDGQHRVCIASEWDEALRYPEFHRLGKEAWVKLASSGKPVTFTLQSVKAINNTDASDPSAFDGLNAEKQKRALAQVNSCEVELPIVARYSDNYLELIAGNTRLTAMMAKESACKVWMFDVPDEVLL